MGGGKNGMRPTGNMLRGMVFIVQFAESKRQKATTAPTAARRWTEKGKTMADILRDPVKIVMVIILLALEIPAAIALVMGWKKACKEAKERRDDG